MQLTIENVNKTFLACCYKQEDLINNEIPADGIYVEGLMLSMYFDPKSVEMQAPHISAMLKQLPHQFLVSGELSEDGNEGGGGWSFINMTADRTQNLWGTHVDAQELVMLAIATGYGRYCMSRELWSSLPAGVPYFEYSNQRLFKVTQEKQNS